MSMPRVINYSKSPFRLKNPPKKLQQFKSKRFLSFKFMFKTDIRKKWLDLFAFFISIENKMIWKKRFLESVGFQNIHRLSKILRVKIVYLGFFSSKSLHLLQILCCMYMLECHQSWLRYRKLHRMNKYHHNKSLKNV